MRVRIVGSLIVVSLIGVACSSAGDVGDPSTTTISDLETTTITSAVVDPTVGTAPGIELDPAPFPSIMLRVDSLIEVSGVSVIGSSVTGEGPTVHSIQFNATIERVLYESRPLNVDTDRAYSFTQKVTVGQGDVDFALESASASDLFVLALRGGAALNLTPRQTVDVEFVVALDGGNAVVAGTAPDLRSPTDFSAVAAVVGGRDDLTGLEALLAWVSEVNDSAATSFTVSDFETAWRQTR